MKAIVKEQPKLYKDWKKGLQLIDRPVPVVRKNDEVQLRVVAAGICGTDVGIYQSKDSLKTSMSHLTTPNVIIGHEFCGRVTDAGDRAKIRLAELVIKKAHEYISVKRFVKNRSARELAADKGFLPYLNEHFIATAEMHLTCGKCAQCKLGEYHVCTNTVIRGLHGDGAFAEYIVLPVRNLLIFKNGEIPDEIVAFMDAIGNATHTVQSLSAIEGKIVAVLA